MDARERMTVRLKELWPHLDERRQRLLAAAEAKAMGYGGVSAVSRAIGLSRVTITKGIGELGLPPLLAGKVRRAGAGRRRLEVRDPGVLQALERLLEPVTRGDPESPLRWTCKSTRTLAAALRRQGHRISHATVAERLQATGYSLQCNRKTEEGQQHPDRNAQFLYINRVVQRALRVGDPVISVDTKKKELVGNYQNAGRQWRARGTAPPVNGHDFPNPAVPRAYPYGIYDFAQNHGFVNIGTDHDTTAFAVASIRGWWRHEGQRLYAGRRRLVITADGGGSNGYRLHGWKVALQRFADATGLSITVCHFPPGTSKWNKVEHRLFSFISSNWRGEPLRDYETIVRLIAHTTTATGLTVTCRLDRRKYPLRRPVSRQELDSLRIVRARFHGEWNYTIRPRTVATCKCY